MAEVEGINRAALEAVAADTGDTSKVRPSKELSGIPLTDRPIPGGYGGGGPPGGNWRQGGGYGGQPGGGYGQGKEFLTMS